MEQWRKYFIITYGFIESLFFSGCLFGWPSLLLILQEEGIYRYVCPTDSYTLTTPSSFNDLEVKGISALGNNDTDKFKAISQMNESLMLHGKKNTGCDEQRIEMTLVYTFAAVAYGITAIFIGVSLEVLGLRLTRLAGTTMLCSGFVILALTSPEKSWLLWPAMTLIALGSNQLRFSAFQFADLLPPYRATILTSYSSAYAVSTTFFILMQILYEATLPMKTIFLVCGIIASLTYIPTFFMPMFKIEVENEKEINEHEDGNVAVTEQSYESRNSNATSKTEGASKQQLSTSISSQNDEDQDDDEDESDKRTEKTEYSRKNILIGALNSVCSLSGILHMYWHFINLFLVLFYSSTLNIWAAKITDDISNISFYIKMSGVCCLVAPFFIPFSGLVTDTMIQKAKKRRTAVEKMAYTMQAPTFAMVGATICLGFVMICKMFLTEPAVYISLILIALGRPAIIGSCTAYIRLRFPAEEFNILNGIFTTVISIFCFVQYPVMKWMTSSNEAYSQVHWLLLISLIVSLTSPGHMMMRNNAMSYARKRLTARH